MSEINNSPSHPRGTAREGENNEPSEEEDEYISGPHPWVHEPLRVPVHIRRWSRFHVQIRHRSDLFHNNITIRFGEEEGERKESLDFWFGLVWFNAGERRRLLFRIYCGIIFN